MVEPLEGRRLLAAINEFGTSAGVNQPSDITAGPDGALWFSQAIGQIGRIGTDGAITQFSAGVTPGSDITSIAAGSDGALWFTSTNQDIVGRITTAGVVTEYDISGGTSIPRLPQRITPGSDGALWFTEGGRSAIGRISTTGAFTEYLVAGGEGAPTGIVSGPDGNLWVLDTIGSSISVFTTSGAFVSQFSDGLTPGAGLTDITNGPDGALWFTETTLGQIGRVTPQGVITEYATGAPNARPYDITAGPDGSLYFTESQGDAIGRITTAGAVTRTPVPTANALPFGVALGSDQNLWFTEYGGTQVGQLVLPTSIGATGQSVTVIAGQASDQVYAAFGDLSTATNADNFLATIDFGDGTAGAGLITQTGPGQFAVRATHAYATTGTFTATVTIGTAIGNAAPVQTGVLSQAPSQITATGSSVSAVAGLPATATFATFVDTNTSLTAGDYQAAIDFGDGSTGLGQITQTGAGQFTVTATHTYATAGQFTATITVGSPLATAAPVPTSVLAEVPSQITASGTDVAAVAGVAATATYAAFVDTNTGLAAGDYQATIDFGDGTAGFGQITQTGPGQFTVTSAHAYAAAGQFTATVTVGSSLATAAPVLTRVVASEAPSQITATGSSVTAVAGVPVTATYATFVDTNSGLAAGDYRAVVDFGDGTTGLGQITRTGPGQFTVTATHTYAAAGSFGAAVVVSRGENSGGTGTIAVTVIGSDEPLDTVVTNTNDSGRGSLRQAILNSNVLPGLNRITFAIPGVGVQTIRPLTPLPDLTDTVTIDGTTQAAFAGVVSATPLIEVDGRLIAGQTSGLRLAGGAQFSNVTDLSVFGFHGAQLEVGSEFSTVLGNYLGLRADGSVPGSDIARASAVDATDVGLRVTGSSARVGGTAAGQRNVIGGNAGSGVEVGGFFTILLGNLVGLDPTGTAARGNGGDGVLIQPGSSFIYVSQGNVISANGGNGVLLLGATDCSILGARIGTDVFGTRALGNSGAGVLLDLGASRNSIGINAFNSTTSPPVLISGNGVAGVVIRAGSLGNSVVGSMIGTDITGTLALGNGSTGLLISDAPDNLVAANLISGNGAGRDGAGVWIEGEQASGNVVRGNFIGTDFAGTRALGNAVIGVLIVDAPGNTVGGIGNGGGPARNVVSGNGQVGVMISGVGATGNVVQGNLIGTDAAGTAAVPNGAGAIGTGVYVNGAAGNTIGGAAAGAGNVISGNRADGVFLFASGSSGNVVQGNFIGTDVTGTRPLGNRRDGVAILNAPRNQVLDNRIAANGRNGIAIGGRLTVGTVVATNTIGGFAPDGRTLLNGDWGVLVTEGAPGRRNPVAASNRIGTNGRGRVQVDPSGFAVVRVRSRAASFGGRALGKVTPAGKTRRPG